MEKDSKRSKPISTQIDDPLDNDARILTCLKLYTSLNNQLYQFQSLLYEKTLNLPRQIFKRFRTIRDTLETTFDTLQGYVSFNQNFIQQKDRILQEQIIMAESQMSSSKVKTSSDGEFPRRRIQTQYTTQPRNVQSNDSKQIQILKGEIENLKNELRRNDAEYEVEIKKYNLKYQEMQDEIKFYQQKMGLVDQYEETIEQLQVEVRIMKELKERDQQLISMARKLKNLEVERNGRSPYLSPNRANPFFSPSRVRSQLSPRPYPKFN